MGCAAFAGGDSTYDVRAVLDRLCGVEGPFPARESLNNQPCFATYQYAHTVSPAAAVGRHLSCEGDYFLGCIRHSLRHREVEARFHQNLPAEFDIGSLHAYDDRNANIQIARRRENAGSQHVAAQDTAEYINENRFDGFVRYQNTKGILNLLGICAAADI